MIEHHDKRNKHPAQQQDPQQTPAQGGMGGDCGDGGGRPPGDNSEYLREDSLKNNSLPCFDREKLREEQERQRAQEQDMRQGR